MSSPPANPDKILALPALMPKLPVNQARLAAARAKPTAEAPFGRYATRRPARLHLYGV